MTHDIITIGGSAGSIDGLVSIIRALPGDLAAAVFAVVHIQPHHNSYLAEILDRGALKAVQVTTRQPIEPAHVYVAAPDSHMLIEKGFALPWRGPREDRHRPAINPLFRSAAETYGPRVVGVVLSGMLQDGSAGLWAIKQRGGVAVIEDPSSAKFASMPETVLEYVKVDHILNPHQIAPLLVELSGVSRPLNSLPGQLPDSGSMESKESIDARCPDCLGPLSEFRSGAFREFRCLVGHSFSPQSVLEAHSETEENTLWSAVAALEESVVLIRRILPDIASHEAAARLNEQIEKRLELARQMRSAIERLDLMEID